MARQALEPGEWGDITTTRVKLARGTGYRCRVRFRDYDGRVRLVERSAPTKHQALTLLTESLTELQSRQHAVLTPRDTLDTAITLWLSDLEQLVRIGERSPGTTQTYRFQWESHVSPGLGALRINQVTTPVVDRFLRDLHERVGYGTARTARAIISGAMGRAVREGAAPSNPTRDVQRLRSTPKKPPRALTEEERATWFAALENDPQAIRRDIVDMSAFMLATGLRIGETLGLLWSEVDLDRGLIDVTSTIIRVKGQGLIRKDTKSDASQRPLVLPEWCTDILRRRHAIGVSPHEPVFGTLDGGYRDPRNVSRWIQAARNKAGLDWVTSHSWRKTTASILDGSGLSARAIADQLGHSRISMTQDVYLGRRTVDPRVVAALQAIDPSTPTPPQKDGQNDGSRRPGIGR